MSDHTPGPWTVEEGHVVSVPLTEIVMVKDDRTGEERPHNRGLVALVYGHHIGDERPRHYTHDANARLIAAAPELLDTLRDLVLAVEKKTTLNYDDAILLNQCRRAIRKAMAPNDGNGVSPEPSDGGGQS